MTMGDIIVITVLMLIIALIVRGMIRDRKKGKCCGCSGCSACASCAACSSCSGNCSGCGEMQNQDISKI